MCGGICGPAGDAGNLKEDLRRTKLGISYEEELERERKRDEELREKKKEAGE